jgi:hypothetical protein
VTSRLARCQSPQKPEVMRTWSIPRGWAESRSVLAGATGASADHVVVAVGAVFIGVFLLVVVVVTLISRAARR